MLQVTMAKQPKPLWWTIRPAQNRKPSTYRCPLCGNQLPSLQAHMLITPEGDSARRRHAHSACVMTARKQGRLPTQAEWRKEQRAAERNGDGDDGAAGSVWARLRALVRRDR
jgi:hypothetical protein